MIDEIKILNMKINNNLYQFKKDSKIVTLKEKYSEWGDIIDNFPLL